MTILLPTWYLYFVATLLVVCVLYFIAKAIYLSIIAIRNRKAEFVCELPAATIDEVLQKLNILLE